MSFIALIIAGAAMTAAGTAINQGEQRSAQKRADAAFETLRVNQKRFDDEAQKNLRGSIEGFDSAVREERRQDAIAENEGVLSNALLRDRDALDGPGPGNASQQFIDRREDSRVALEDRALNKAGLFAKVTAPGQANFEERKGLVQSSGRANTNRLLSRGQLGVDTDIVNAAAVPDRDLLGDILQGLGPAVASAGVLGALAAPLTPAIAPVGGQLGALKGISAALAQLPGGAIPGAAGGTLLPTLGAGLTGGVSSTLNSPVRGFARR